MLTIPNVRRCFQCLYSLLGYNEVERRFQVMPNKIRSTPTVNAFLANLPQMLDYNFAMGEANLLNTILILQKLPFPPRYASSWQQSHTLMQESQLFQGCGFSLWYLEPSLRKNWLMSALVIFYKYDFYADTILGDKAIGIVRIVLHTLAAHAHACDRFNKPTFGTGGVPARSRDLSQVSIGDMEKGDEEEPESPPSNADEAEEVSDDGDEEEDDEEEEEDEEEGGGDDPELQPILAKKSATPGSSPEKKAEPWKRTAATVESPPKPVADSASASEEGDVRAPMANLFGFLPRPAFQQQSAAASAPTPDHHRLTSEGLPQGWTMQLMRNGRTLFIDNTNQVRKNIVQKPFVCAPLLILCLPR
jgi:hypothetical protein